MDIYEVNNDTLAVIFKDKTVTQIIEIADEFLISDRPTNVIDYSCRYFGSSLEGRKEGTKKMIDVTHKAPIIVEESNDLIFVPTHSPSHPECSWLNVNNIVHYRRSGENKTMVVFKNGINLEINVRFGSMNNQILRATRLVNVLRSRKNNKIKAL